MKKVLIVVIIFFAVSMVLSSLARRPVSSTPNEVLFTVNSGEGVQEIAKRLQDEGLIRDQHAFVAEAIVTGQRSSLQAGSYFLSPHLSLAETVRIIAQGDIASHRLTIIEGWRATQIAEYLEDEGVCSAEDFLSLAKEGYLFPDTYQVPLEITAEKMVEIMENNFKRQIAELNIPEEKLSDIIIMASILEKEVRTIEDKKIASGIFWKRIKIGMPLQSCATIAYITGKNTTKISIAETRIKSPYNTYINKGLPPAPINNPGLASIEAAANPTDTSYWFYLSKPNGETVWSSTLDEHNKAKEMYLR